MRAEFDMELLRNERVSVMTDFRKGEDLLLISFAGVGLGMGVPYFEFLKLIGDLPVQRMFVRDLEKSWYQAGLRGLADDLDEATEVLRGLVAESGAKRVLTLGNSMGGYAAILFGALLEADMVLAFGATTFANLGNRLRYLDFRPLFAHLRKASIKTKKHLDLRWVPGIEKPEIHIYFDVAYREDRLHAQHLSKVGENVHLHPCQIGGKHHVIKKLKETGAHRSIIQSAVHQLL